MALPSELILGSVQYLEKADLKKVRLVSKLWSGCASEHLFAKIFISPHRLNVESFLSITQDPRLNKCVKELEYDGIHFSPFITISEYFQILWRQTWTTFWHKHLHESANPEIKAYYKFVWDDVDSLILPSTQDMKVEAEKQCIGFAFVQKGYQKWMQAATFERQCDKMNFLQLLISGLRQLPRLESVKLKGEWPSRSEYGHIGSPLARSWPRLFAYPEDFNEDASWPLGPFQLLHSYQVLTLALWKAGNPRFRKLTIGNSLPPGGFVQDQGEDQDSVDHAVATYSRLTHLTLPFAYWPNVNGLESNGKLYGLQRMLGSMTLLEELKLELPDYNYMQPPTYLRYDLAFPKTGSWPHLRFMKVENLAIGTKDLMTLFVVKMPSLKQLIFGRVKLVDGCWEGIVEYLRVSRRLSYFSNARLLHREDKVYLSLSSEDPLAVHHRNIKRTFDENLYSISTYVEDGRSNPTSRHPSLLPHQPARDSQAYLSNLFRLCEEYDARGEQTVLVRTMLEENALHLRLMAEREELVSKP